MDAVSYTPRNIRRRESIRITQDICPLADFNKDSARMIAKIKETGRPQILTVMAVHL